MLGLGGGEKGGVHRASHPTVEGCIVPMVASTVPSPAASPRGLGGGLGNKMSGRGEQG